jgi:hypothetical protein
MKQTAASINLISVLKIILANNGELVLNYAKVAIDENINVIAMKIIIYNQMDLVVKAKTTISLWQFTVPETNSGKLI